MDIEEGIYDSVTGVVVPDSMDFPEGWMYRAPEQLVRVYRERDVDGALWLPVSCQECGTSTGEINFDVNPFNYDIYGDETKVWLCNDCAYAEQEI